MEMNTIPQSKEESLFINLARNVGPEMEHACRAYDPVLFGNNPIEAHRAASPLMLEVAQREVISKLTPVVNLLFSANLRLTNSGVNHS